MPNYFADYETKVTFITEEELLREHSQMPHGGLVIRSATTGPTGRTPPSGGVLPAVRQ